MVEVRCAHSADGILWLNDDFSEAAYCTRCGAYKAKSNQPWEMPALLNNTCAESNCPHYLTSAFTDERGIYKIVCGHCGSFRVFGHSFGDWQDASRDIDEVIENGE